MKIYSEIVFNNFSTKTFLRHLHNPIREYESEIIDGAIIDFGCGQTSLLLDYANYNRDLFAVDNEQCQLDMLKQRVNGLGNNLANWNYINSDFFKQNFPDKIFSIMFFSNILHFFTLKECEEVIGKIMNHSAKGTLIYISVHSNKFYANNPNDPGNNDYFKHYFSSNDLIDLFKPEYFEIIYSAEIEKVDSITELQLTDMWLEKSYEYYGITDRQIIENGKKRYLKNKKQSDIVSVFKRK